MDIRATDMALEAARAALKGDGAGDEENKAKLREACEGFEGIFLGILLKEGLKPGMSIDGSEMAPSAVTLQEFAIEQMAQQMAREGGIGLADSLYEQFLEAENSIPLRART